MKVIKKIKCNNFLSFPLHTPPDGEFDGLSIVPIFTSMRGILASIEPLQEMPAMNLSSQNLRLKNQT
jgi:hypothetical protein